MLPSTMFGTLNLATLAVFVFAICFAAIEDVRSFKIPNWTAATVAVAFIPYYLMHSWLFPIGMHLAIAGMIFAITFVFWRLRFIGGGDVKLLTAVGLWLGPELALPFVLIMSLVAVAIALAFLAIRKFAWILQGAGAPSPVLRVVAVAETGKCPYAVPIAIAAIMTVPQRFF